MKKLLIAVALISFAGVAFAQAPAAAPAAPAAEAPKAEKKLSQVNDLLAAHEIRIGDWYLKDGHPKGAFLKEGDYGLLDPMSANAVYDEGKKFAETLCMAYRERFNLDTKIIRIFRTYGPRLPLFEGNMIPDFVVAALDNQPLVIYSDESFTTSLVFVDDVVTACHKAMSSGESGPFNVGGPIAYKLVDVAKEIIKLTNSESQIEFAAKFIGLLYDGNGNTKFRKLCRSFHTCNTTANNFQDVAGFLASGGQRGPQRQILREGTYAINLAQFVVITESRVYYLSLGRDDQSAIQSMSEVLTQRHGFTPVVIKDLDDLAGIVTVHDGPSLTTGEIIAPVVGENSSDTATYHNNFQMPDRFLKAGAAGFLTFSQQSAWPER